jgi:hypothetical protein
MEIEPPEKFEESMCNYLPRRLCNYLPRRFSFLVINVITAHCLLTIFLTGCLGLPRAAAIETTLIIEPTKAHPRNSEGDIIELQDGRLCLIYTQFDGGTSDHAAANLVMRISDDRGKSWSDDKSVVFNEGGKNVMSVSLLRLQTGELALFYLRKYSLQDCRPFMRISDDEAVSWSDPVGCITDEIGYYVLNNDRAVQLTNGRIVLPVAMHATVEQPQWNAAGKIMCYLSDDQGKTWWRSRKVEIGKNPKGQGAVIQEPGVVELKDGQLMMFCRTDGGSQYVAHSTDAGDTWSELRPSPLASPRSPATIKRNPFNGNLVCVWNDHSGLHPFVNGKRTPLCLAISADEGQTWSPSRVIEDDRDGWYCYTSMTFHKGQLFLVYCAGDKKVGGLNRLKVLAVAQSDLEQTGALKENLRPATALLQPVLDYGRSFINTRADFNSPRFWVESRCRLSDTATEKSIEYYQCGSCKSEDTFAEQDLFLQDNYDFLPVLSADDGIVFRHHLTGAGRYREVRPINDWWGGIVPKLRSAQARVLRTSQEIFEAMEQGKPIVGQTELRDQSTGRIAVLEYPVKTINWHRDKKLWQVDTGPVLLPDLTVPPDAWPQTIQLAYIAFNRFDRADFVVKKPTPIAEVNTKILHYSEIAHWPTRNVLLAIDD